MITSITGQLVAATPLTATIEVGGFGYEVHIPVTTAERLPSLGQQAKLHTVAVYREDSQTLYGFSTEEERNFFRLLVEKVTGVGPELAGAAATQAGAGAAPVASVENKIRDAVLALVALGYRAVDADKAVRQAWVTLGPTTSTESLIKKALG